MYMYWAFFHLFLFSGIHTYTMQTNNLYELFGTREQNIKKKTNCVHNVMYVLHIAIQQNILKPIPPHTQKWHKKLCTLKEKK